MKKFTTLSIICFCFCLHSLQAQNYWQQKDPVSVTKNKFNAQRTPKKFKTFELQVQAFKEILKDAPMRGDSRSSDVIIAFPMADGSFQNFRIVEAPVLDAELSELYPDIKSYAGQGIENPSEVIRFSVTPRGVKSMLLSSERGSQFIEPYSEDLTYYMVYNKKDGKTPETPFECSTQNIASQKMYNDNQDLVLKNADDGILRTYDLAITTNGEYTAYFGGTVALALAAINATMTQVNGIFETDFNITMVVIASSQNVIYLDENTDPYNGDSLLTVHNTLDSVIGEANYDIGHLFSGIGNLVGDIVGYAGEIGAVCTDGDKDQAYTSSAVPEGVVFDHLVAHEMGHQFGANHTMTYDGNEGTNTQMEPGSGSTIMSYAGFTDFVYDVQAQSDPYFHAISIKQITNYVKGHNCHTATITGNAVPTADAGINYKIPRGTPFTLTGVGNDNDAGDVLTYCWEQFDDNNAANTLPGVFYISGVSFRSFPPSASPERTFPELSTILAGNTSNMWEAVPNVGRKLKFRFTVRDNRAGGGANEGDRMSVTVDGATGPFVISSPNTNVSWAPGSSQTVTWEVAGTDGAPINANNVDILLSTDGGYNFNTVLAANTPNDGAQTIIVPNTIGSNNRIKVKATNNIFFDISNTDFSITSCPTPTGLAISNISSSSAKASWTAIPGASSYKLRYREIGAPSWITKNASGTSKTLWNLSSQTSYEVKVKTVCPEKKSPWSDEVNFSTSSMNGAMVINGASGTNVSTDKEMSLFPNPSQGILNVNFQSTAKTTGTIRILDILGRPVTQVQHCELSKGNNSYKLNLSQLLEGTYFLELNDGNDITVKRFVIKH